MPCAKSQNLFSEGSFLGCWGFRSGYPLSIYGGVPELGGSLFLAGLYSGWTGGASTLGSLHAKLSEDCRVKAEGPKSKPQILDRSRPEP